MKLLYYFQVCVDAFAVLTYITDYFSKGDVGLTRELKQAIKQTRGMNKFEALNYIKRIFFTHRQVSFHLNWEKC